MDFTPEQAARARQQAIALKRVLEPQILGKHLEGWQCNCGALHAGEAIAIEVVTPDDRYGTYQKVLHYLWSVKMREVAHPEQDYSYSTGLSFFIARDEILRLFDQYFGELIDIAEAPRS